MNSFDKLNHEFDVFISQGICFKSFQDGGIVCSPGIAECTLTDLIRIWGRGCEDDIKGLDLMILGFWATA